MTLVNYDPLSGRKEGSFSLVFKAFDKVEGKPVALKFYDPDPLWVNNLYRMSCFARESDILRDVLGVDRCLQLVRPLTTYDIAIPVAGTGVVATLSCQYFVVDWLDDKIDHYFLNQDKYDALEKLELFNEILLAVDALHRKEIFHRDLKADNLRGYRVKGRRSVVAIDLGTAAKFFSPSLDPTSYPMGAVGAFPFASPEALCRLATVRPLGRYCDVYALGCLLFQLFHYDLYYNAVRYVNLDYDVRLSALSSMLPIGGSEAARLAQWQSGVDIFGRGVVPVPMDGSGSSAPAGVATLIGALLSGLTHIDYRKRLTLDVARRKVWTAITVLRNERLYRRRVERRRIRREQRIQKLMAKQQRLLAATNPSEGRNARS